MSSLSQFYDEHTTAIDVAWDAKLAHLRKIGMADEKLDAVQQYLVDSFSAARFTQYGHRIKGQLIDANAKVWHMFVKARTEVPDELAVPIVLDQIAQLYHNERSGRTGKGEFLIPLLFKDAVWNSHEAIYDVTINGQHWHVKAIKRPYEAAKLNLCGYANGAICKALSDFMPASQLSAGMKPTGLLANLDNVKKISWFEGCITDRDVIMHFQHLIDAEMRKLSIGDAQGIIFYLEPERKFIFKSRDDVYCAGATQSNHKASMQPYFFVNAYDKIQRAKERAAEHARRRAERQAAREARAVIKARLAQERLEAKERRQRDAEQLAQNIVHAREFLTILRDAHRYAARRKSRPTPSFSALLKDFVRDRGLQYEHFNCFLLNNSSCKKTFSKLQQKCP